jgi:hypothetical protein
LLLSSVNSLFRGFEVEGRYMLHGKGLAVPDEDRVQGQIKQDILNLYMKKSVLCLLISIAYSSPLPKREMPMTYLDNDYPGIERSDAFDEDDESVNPLEEGPTNEGNVIHDLEPFSETDHQVSRLQHLREVIYSFIRGVQQARFGAGSQAARPIAFAETPPNSNSIFRLE